MSPRYHAIRVVLGSPATPTRVFQGDDERAICIQAEEVVRDALMQGGGIGYHVSCRDPEADKRIRAYLAGVGYEIQTWPGKRRGAKV